MRVDVALAFNVPYVVAVNGKVAPAPSESVPQTSTPPAFAFTSQLPAERLATVSDVVVAFVVLRFVAKRLVLVALVEVERMVESRVMEEEAFSMMPMVVVGVRLPFTSVQSLNWEFQYSWEVVLKKLVTDV